MGSYDIEALKSALFALVESQRESTKELRRAVGPLELLPDMFQEQAEILQEGFSNTTKVLAEIEIARAQADSQGMEGAWTQLSSSLEEALTEYEETVTAIGQRYAKLQEDLNREASSRVEQLDGPALGLMNRDLEAVVHWYRDVYAPESQDVLDAMSTIGDIRESTLALYIGAFEQQASEFVSQRERCRDQLSSALHGGTPDVPTEIRVPVHLVEIENLQGGGAASTQTLAFVDPDLDAVSPEHQDLSPATLSHDALRTLVTFLNNAEEGPSRGRQLLQDAAPVAAPERSRLESLAAQFLDKNHCSASARDLARRLQRNEIGVLG